MGAIPNPKDIPERAQVRQVGPHSYLLKLIGSRVFEEFVVVRNKPKIYSPETKGEASHLFGETPVRNLHLGRFKNERLACYPKLQWSERQAYVFCSESFPFRSMGNSTLLTLLKQHHMSSQHLVVFLVSYITMMLRYNFLIFLESLKVLLKAKVVVDRWLQLQSLQIWCYWFLMRLKVRAIDRF